MKHNVETLRKNLTQAELNAFEKELRERLFDWRVRYPTWKDDTCKISIKEILGEDDYE